MSEPETRLLPYITNLFITVFTGIAVKKAMDTVIDMINRNTLQLEAWILLLTFFVTLARFSFGNIAHSLHLSKHAVSPFVYLYDLLFMCGEFSLLIIMGGIFNTKRILFVYLLISLLLLDTSWVLSMFPMASRGMRPIVPWAWGVINIVAGCLLYLIARDADFLLSVLGLSLVLLLSLNAAFVDVILVDHYELMRTSKK